MKTSMLRAVRTGAGRLALVATAATALTLAVPLAADAAPRDGRGLPGCPADAQLVARFGAGLSRLVAAGDLTRAEAREARDQFAGWVADTDDAGCALRDGMLREGREFLAFVDLTPAELRAGFRDGKSLAEMAAAATADGDDPVDRQELVRYLEDAIDEGLDALVAAGALTDAARDAIDARATSHVEDAVDYRRGDPLPEGHPKNG